MILFFTCFDMIGGKIKKAFIALVLLFTLLLCSCDKTVYHWELLHDESEIVGIYIVEAENPYDYEIIKEISLDKKGDLISDIRALDYRKYSWFMHDTSGLCFVIKYKNYENDVISAKEPTHVIINGARRERMFSWLECDEEAFSALIEKYMEK